MKTSGRPVVYQLFPRLFANSNDRLTPGGRIETNGSGKLNDINDDVLSSIADLGVTHIWYTGIIEHAHDVDYTAYGIRRHNPHIIKGRAGSPYAITDYYDIDPDLAVDVPARMAEFEALVRRTKSHGMKVIIDFVPNHLAREYSSDNSPEAIADFGRDDNREMFFSPNNNFFYIPRQQFAPVDVDLGAENNNPYIEFPARATGNDCFTAFPNRNDWYETVKINYGVDPANGSKHFDPIPDTWLKMLHILRFWATKGIDGFRCDMAHMVPEEFWAWAIPQVKADYPKIIFIAELYDVGIYRSYLEAGFDYLYDKVNLYDTLRAIRSGHASAAQLTSCWQTVDGINDRMLNFLENHDEQRFASDFYATDASLAEPELTAIATMSKGAVMIYNGQEIGERGMDCEGFSGCDGRTTIFDFWSMETVRRWLGKGFKPSFENLTRDEQRLRNLYCRLLNLVNKEAALRDGAFFDLMYVNYESEGLNPHRHYAYLRATATEAILIFLNFDHRDASAKIKIPSHAFNILNLGIGHFDAIDLLSAKRRELVLQPDGVVEIEVGANRAAMLKFPTSQHNRCVSHQHNKIS